MLIFAMGLYTHRSIQSGLLWHTLINNAIKHLQEHDSLLDNNIYSKSACLVFTLAPSKNRVRPRTQVFC